MKSDLVLWRVSRTVKAHVLLILITLVWGVTFVVIKNAIEDVPPLQFNTARMGLAALALVLMYFRRLRGLTRGSLLAALSCGIFLWAGYEFQTTGLRLTTPSKSAFLTGVSVVLVPLFLALFWRRRFKAWTWAGVLAAFVGLYLLTVPAANGSGWLHGVNAGDVLTLGCAVVFAFQIIFVGRASGRYPFEQVATVQVAVAAVLMALAVPVFGFAEPARAQWTPRALWAIVITGLLCTAVAFAVQAWAQQFTSPTYTALIFALEPVFAWMTSLVVLGERLGYRAGVGAVLILVGIVVAEMKGGSDQSGGRQERRGREP